MKYTFVSAISDLTDAGAFEAGLSDAGKRAITNEALEAILLSGRWNGSHSQLAMTVNAAGEITLPRHFQTVLGVKVEGTVRDLASPWYAYLQGTSDVTQFNCNVQDRGDGFATFADPATPAKLRVATTGTTGTVEVHGLSASGAEIWSVAQHGELLTIGSNKTGAYFTKVTEIIKPVTTQLLQLYACYDNATEEVIAILEPGELVPSYRRYYIPDLDSTQNPNVDATTIVTALCLRRHVKLVADNDLLPISNFKALKNAVISVHFGNESDPQREDYHMNLAIDALNGELKLLRPPSESAGVRVNASLCGAIGLRSTL